MYDENMYWKYMMKISSYKIFLAIIKYKFLIILTLNNEKKSEKYFKPFYLQNITQCPTQKSPNVWHQKSTDVSYQSRLEKLTMLDFCPDRRRTSGGH